MNLANMFFKFGPSFASAQLALALRGFLSRPTCLSSVLAGGSTANSSSQLQPNKSWSRIPVNCGRARAAWRTRIHSGPQCSRGWGDSQSQPGLHWQGVFSDQFELSRSLAEPTWASGKFKSIMSRPVTSWPEPGARRDQRRTSDTSQKVLCHASVDFTEYEPCISPRYHHGMNACSVVV